jgi:putative heme-binding domain-containing protein
MCFAFRPAIATVLASVSLISICFGSSSSAPQKTAFQFREGDRVVLIGDTLIEREAAYGYIEQRLTAQFPDRHIIFRNLGWSADTPAGDSRASFDFDKPGKGFEKIKEQLTALQPTVLMVGYGMADSFAGAEGLPQFRKNLERLLDTARDVSTNHQVRVLLLSPIRHEDLGRPLPDPGPHNKSLAQYCKVIEEVAQKRACPYPDLFDLEAAAGGKSRAPLTDNGIHLSERGYARAAEILARELGWQSGPLQVKVAAGDKNNTSGGIKISQSHFSPNGGRFQISPERLPSCPRVSVSDAADASCQLQIEGLATGNYELKVDGKHVVSASGKEWARGVPILSGPDFEQAEALRQTIRRKNELYFNRWRPQNETYLFGFRKHEQGQNAKEIPMFDPLIDEQEKKIDELKKPRTREFELVRLNTEQSSPIASKDSGHESFRSVIRLQRPGSAGVSPASSSAAFPLTGDTPPPPLAADTNRPSFDVADGFEVNLYAASPLLAKPIEMNFDPEGRLWIASSSVYPQILPGQVADDKIIVLEDTDHDGYAEKSTVFADGLFIPTGVAPGDGGAYVGQSTELLHFKDTDGDGKADEKRVVLSAFGTEDTHHMVHTLRWGPDGRLYFNQSIYIHTYIETPSGVKKLNSGGVWQFRPSNMDLDVFVRGFCNPWGQEFDAYGQSFLTDGAGSQGICYGLPGATYFTYAIMRREMPSISPGSYPKFCSLEIVRSEHFPKDWQGNVITCDFRAHRVVRFGIEEKGAGYAAHEIADLIRSTNVSFRPIDVKLGPDGALYIADWSNPIIQHGEVDFRDARRDHEHGRIWRVTMKGKPTLAWPSLRSAANQELFQQLLSSNSFNQEQARRVLTERGKAIQKDLGRWTEQQKSDEALLQALWMYQALDTVEPRLLARVLKATDGRIRAAAVRVTGAWHDHLSNARDLLAAAIKDEHPRVRLEAARALATIPSSKSAELVLGLLDKPMDSFLDYAVWLSINDLAKPWLHAIETDAWKSEGREKELEFGLKAVEPSLASAALARVLQKRPISRDGSGPWLDLIKTAGDENLLRRLFDQVLTNGFNETASVKALQTLAAAARDRQLKPSGKLDSLKPLLTHGDVKIRQEALRLAGNWKLEQFAPEIADTAANKANNESLRTAAFGALREIGGDLAKAKLKAMSAADLDPWGKRQAILTWAALDLDGASAAAVSTLLKISDEKDAEEFWKSLLAVKGSAPALVRALPKTGLPAPMARAGLRAARAGGRNEPDLVWALTRGANLEEEAQILSPAELQRLAQTVMKEGDPARGEKIFRRKELSCINCHAIGGVGGKVGPDLTSIGASAQTDYLIESVLYPNRKIKEGYHTVIVETKDGEDLSGILASENTDKLVLRDSTGKEKEISKKDIAKRVTGASLMPGGLVDALTAKERLDLYRFLSELGKPGPFDAAKARVARAWKLFPQTVDLAQFGDEKILSTALTNSQWMPAISLVDGRLVKKELTSALAEVKHRDPPALYAAAQFEVARTGPVFLKLDGPATAQVWVDGKPVQGANEFHPELSTGRHLAVIKLDATKLPDALKLESDDVTFVAE